MLKVLELFSGTGSIGKCCKELGYIYYNVLMIVYIHYLFEFKFSFFFNILLYSNV